MPEHLHMLMTLPKDDANYSMRWNLIKGCFSRQINLGEHISKNRIKKRERGIWQRRFWEHVIRDERDYEKHVDYVHFNPVKHGYVKKAVDWKFSSIHQYIANGLLTVDWACEPELKASEFGE